MSIKLTNKKMKAIERFKKITFEDYNNMYLLLQFGNINEAAKLINISHNNIKPILILLSNYDNLLLNAYLNHKNKSTLMLLEKQSQKDINKVKQSYNNIQQINNQIKNDE